MIKIPNADDIERLARAAGKSVRQVCIQAKVHQPVFSRWKHGTGQISAKQLQDLLDAVQSSEDRAA